MWKKVEGSSEFNETWKPEKDDVLEGKYIEKKTDVGPNKSNKYVIKKEDDSLIEVWGGTLLDDRFEQIEIGNSVRITFLGEVKGKNSKPYKNYQVEVDNGELDEIPF